MISNSARIGIISIVFLLFLANAVGLVNLQITAAPVLSITSFWTVDKVDAFLSLLFQPEFILFILIGLALSISLPLLSPIYASLLTLMAVMPPVYLSYTGTLDGTSLPMEYFLLTVLILYVVNVLIAYFEETHIRQSIIETFSHYAPPEIVHELCRHSRKPTMSGEAREMSVIFCDLVNFSSIAEKISPQDLTSLLNKHFTRATDILHHHKATIDKFIGDAVMAFWGAPLAQSNHASMAVAASFELHKGIEDLNSELNVQGWPRLEMCIGINSGIMNVGNMGTKHRVSYTVIGDAVNVASRLEQLTRAYQVNTIVSESTRLSAPEYIYRLLDRVHIKGRVLPVLIYEPVCSKMDIDDTTKSFITTQEKAVNLYIEGKLEESIRMFKELQTIRPNDGYVLYMTDKLNKELSGGEYTNNITSA